MVVIVMAVLFVVGVGHSLGWGESWGERSM
jgi:hypothetical protein